MARRCAQLIETLGFGGAETLAVRVANGMAARGWRSRLIVIGEPGPLSDRAASGVDVVHLGFERASIGRPVAFLASVRRGERLLARTIDGLGGEIVQSHLPGANFWGLLMAIRHGVTVMPTVHNNREFDYGDEDARLRSFLRREAYRRMVRHCARMIAVSADVRTSLAAELGLDGRSADRIEIVRNGIDMPPDLPAEARTAIRSRLGIGPGEPLVLAAGRLCEQKGFEVLVRATAVLPPDARPRVVIAGEGPLRGELEALVRRLDLASTVSLPGNLPDLREVMQAADLFVLPSAWEGLPLVLLEAMAAGTAAVASDIDGVREVITGRQDGLLVAPGDAGALAGAMAGLLADDRHRSGLAEAGRDMVSRTFDFAHVLDGLEDLYLRVSGGRGPRE